MVSSTLGRSKRESLDCSTGENQSALSSFDETREGSMEDYKRLTVKTLGPVCLAAVIAILLALALNIITGGVITSILILIGVLSGFVVGWNQAKKQD